jgi:sugar/nucleoside kinase (ribokinase family)
MAIGDFDLLVVGDANPDVILLGAPRVPEFGQREQLVSGGHLVLGGSGAITASAAARLGLRTAFVGRIGDDPAGRFTLDSLRRHGVDVSACVIDSAPTALTVVLASGNDRAILTAPGCLDRLGPEDVPPELLARASHLHVSSYFLQPHLVAGLPTLFHTAREAGLSTSLDTNDDPSGKWHGVDEVLPVTDLLLPNEREALALAGRTDGNLEKAVWDLARLGTTPVVKCGDRGVLTIDDGEVVRVPARRVRVIDTVGAGDNFNAGLIAAHIRNLPLRRGIEIAVACGTLSTRAAGGTAATLTWEEVNL